MKMKLKGEKLEYAFASQACRALFCWMIIFHEVLNWSGYLKTQFLNLVNYLKPLKMHLGQFFENLYYAEKNDSAHSDTNLYI